MSGISIAGQLLVGAPDLAEIAAADAIKAWKLPDGIGLPSILLTRVSRVKQQFLAAEQVWLVTERVQVTVRAADGEERDAILKAGERSCVDRTGTIAGFANVAVLHAGAGPDFMDDDASIFMGSFDLRISFNEPA